MPFQIKGVFSVEGKPGIKLDYIIKEELEHPIKALKVRPGFKEAWMEAVDCPWKIKKYEYVMEELDRLMTLAPNGVFEIS